MYPFQLPGTPKDPASRLPLAHIAGDAHELVVTHPLELLVLHVQGVLLERRRLTTRQAGREGGEGEREGASLDHRKLKRRECRRIPATPAPCPAPPSSRPRPAAPRPPSRAAHGPATSSRRRLAVSAVHTKSSSKSRSDDAHLTRVWSRHLLTFTPAPPPWSLWLRPPAPPDDCSSATSSSSSSSSVTRSTGAGWAATRGLGGWQTRHVVRSCQIGLRHETGVFTSLAHPKYLVYSASAWSQ